MPVSIRPGYPANSPQNLRSTVAQQPGNSMFLQTMRPQYRLVNQPSVGDVLCSLAFGINLSQIKRMFRTSQPIPPAAFNRLARAYAGTVNNTGILGSGNGGAYSDSSAAQGYGDGSYIMDSSGNVGFDGSYVDGQVSTDWGFGDDGFNMGGLDLGGFDPSGLGFGGLDMSGFGFSM